LVWSDQQVKDAFEKDISRFEIAVNNAVTRLLKQNQFDALVSFAFNVGPAGMRGSQVVKCINAGNFTLAAAAFDNWHIPPEITSRRNGEREQFKGTHFTPTYSEAA
jgi:lysozyme